MAHITEQENGASRNIWVENAVSQHQKLWFNVFVCYREKVRVKPIKPHQFRFRSTISRREPSIKWSPRCNNIAQGLPQNAGRTIISDFGLPGLGQLKYLLKWDGFLTCGLDQILMRGMRINAETNSECFKKLYFLVLKLYGNVPFYVFVMFGIYIIIFDIDSQNGICYQV